MDQLQLQSMQAQIDKLTQDLKDLNDEYYKNNFSGHQDFNKASVFSTRLQIPHYDTIPSVGQKGDILESGGKLYICSSTNNYTVVGTQT